MTDWGRGSGAPRAQRPMYIRADSRCAGNAFRPRLGGARGIATKVRPRLGVGRAKVQEFKS